MLKGTSAIFFSLFFSTDQSHDVPKSTECYWDVNLILYQCHNYGSQGCTYHLGPLDLESVALPPRHPCLSEAL